MRQAAVGVTTLVIFGWAATGAVTDERVGRSYQRVDVARGIYAFLSPESGSGFVSGNSTVIIGDRVALVVDSGNVPALTRKMIDEIKQLTDKPVRYLVNTHWHPDHMAGNGEYRRAFAGLTIITTRNAAQQFESVQGYLTSAAKTLPAYREAVRQQVDTGKASSGADLTDLQREFFQAQLADFADAIPAFTEARVDTPDVTFDDEVVVDLGGRHVRIVHPGRANTAGDAIVYVADAKVLCAGDLVVWPTPYAIGSFPGEWADAMKTIMAMDATVYVPGHGPVLRDLTYVATVTALLESTVSQVRAAVLAGRTLEHTRQAVDFATFRAKLAGDNRLRAKAFDDYFAAPAVERAFYEATLELGGESRVINRPQ